MLPALLQTKHLDELTPRIQCSQMKLIWFLTTPSKQQERIWWQLKLCQNLLEVLQQNGSSRWRKIQTLLSAMFFNSFPWVTEDYKNRNNWKTTSEADQKPLQAGFMTNISPIWELGKLLVCLWKANSSGRIIASDTWITTKRNVAAYVTPRLSNEALVRQNILWTGISRLKSLLKLVLIVRKNDFLSPWNQLESQII